MIVYVVDGTDAGIMQSFVRQACLQRHLSAPLLPLETQPRYRLYRKASEGMGRARAYMLPAESYMLASSRHAVAMSGKGGCLPAYHRVQTRFELCHCSVMQGLQCLIWLFPNHPSVACMQPCRQFSWYQLPCHQTLQLSERLLMQLQHTMPHWQVSLTATGPPCNSRPGWQPLWRLQLLRQPSRYVARVLPLGCVSACICVEPVPCIKAWPAGWAVNRILANSKPLLLHGL